MYLIQTPFWLRLLYPHCTWKMPSKEKAIYLTFDDGPHPEATPFVLNQLAQFNAKATFFCIGKNVVSHPNLYQQILQEGHKVGNHTQDHMNGWETDDSTYIENIEIAASSIVSDLFRPPYGRIKRSQIKSIQQKTQLPQQIIMWDVLSGDFDININGAKCTRNVIQHAKAGSIIVFHDSAKAFDRMKIALPNVLQYFSSLGYQMKSI